MRVEEVKDDDTYKIKYTKLDYGDFCDMFGENVAIHVYAEYIISECNLLESNSEESIAEFDSLEGEKPVVGNIYYGLHIGLTNGKIQPLGNFKGKVDSVISNPFGDTYIIELKDGTKAPYPQYDTQEILKSKVLLSSSKEDHESEMMSMKLKFGIDFDAIREQMVV
jgi:hypothetical protein